MQHDYDTDEAAWAAFAKWQRRQDFIYWLNAIWTLLTKKLEEGNFFHRVACLICLLLVRDHKGDDFMKHTVLVAMWGHKQLYAGWEAMFIDFSLKEFRYSIFSDGDWVM